MNKPLLTRSQAALPAWERGANAEQLTLIRHEAGPARVLAAAGAGKTFGVTRRIVRLVEHVGVPGERILAVTFSTKAAGEMSKRVRELGVVDARVGTWHSLCLQILREDRTQWSSWTIEGDGPGTSPKMVLKDVLGFRGMDWKGADVTKLQRFIAICKANLWGPSSPEAEARAREVFGRGAEPSRALIAFHKYDEALADKALLTFDDYLVFAARHLEDESNRKRWASRWDHILVDETQDNNGAQWRIAELLAREHRNFMAVGDCFQAIFKFRGSSPDYLANFSSHWEGALTIALPRNYRSGRAIIQAANAIVRKAVIPGLAPTPMIGERPDEGTVRVIACESLDDEAAEIVGAIERSVDAGESTLADHTVLFRTNAQTRAVEECLLKHRIPYVVVGGVSFYERKEVRDLLAYLRLATRTGRLDDVKRSINTPFRFLGAKFVERVVAEAERAGDDVDWPSLLEGLARDGDGLQQRQRESSREWAAIIRDMQAALARAIEVEADDDARRQASPAMLLQEVVKRTGYIGWLTKEEGEESPENSAVANVREMVRVADRFPSATELLEYVGETIRKSRQQRQDKQAGGERVLLMTIHRGKGLEWPNVYVAGMNEMLLPHIAAIREGDVEEERRLAYVAVTRARDRLTMSYVRRLSTMAGVRDVEPSRFLRDCKVSADEPASIEDEALGEA